MDSVFESLLSGERIPGFHRVTYNVKAESLPDVEGALREAVRRRGALERIRPGDSVAIAAGSREMRDIVAIVRALVALVKERGGEPFLVPAMGSHGGCLAEGQKRILLEFGLTPENVGAEIRSSMETVSLGKTESGFDARIDRIASQADWIIPIGRVKPHTDIRGPVESGILKMIAIGLGKQHGADICHSRGYGQMSKNIREIGQYVIEHSNILFGLGVIENGFHQTYRIEAVPPERISLEEPALLAEAKKQIIGIPFDKIDVLVVDFIGKDISGAGMDPNVTGRSALNGRSRPFAERIVVRDLTDKSHHNGTGIGNADVTTLRFFKKFDMLETYPNSITCCDVNGFRIPVIMPGDETAIKFAMHTATDEIDRALGYRIVWIKSSNDLKSFHISEALRAQAEANPALAVDPEPLEPVFEGGEFVRWVPGGSARGLCPLDSRQGD